MWVIIVRPSVGPSTVMITVKLGRRGEVAVPNEGMFHHPNESMLTTFDDGQVMLITRSVSQPNRKIVTKSKTGIGDWGTPQFHPQLLEPVCMASILSVPSRDGDEELVLFTNPHSVAKIKRVRKYRLAAASVVI